MGVAVHANQLPFRVSRQLRASLIDQVADGLRSAIVTGHYKPGDRLPNLHAMADALQVSEIVTRRAVQRLTTEGLLNPRRGTGIEVRGAGLKTWRGHVLFIHWSGAGMYYHSILADLMVETLHRANVLVSTVQVSGPDVVNGFAKVRAELGHVISLAVVEGSLHGLERLLAERNIPFLSIGAAGANVPAAVRQIAIRHDSVLPALRDHCRACGIRTVWQVSQQLGPSLDIAPVLTADGMAVETLRAEPVTGLDSPEAVERGALLAMQRWLDTRPRLPDLLWFSDDFVARGALLALTARGLRVPEDVQVISWANKGLGPIFLKPLTRVEVDPKAHGATVAQCILEQLSGRPNGQESVELAPAFITGETTLLRREGYAGQACGRGRRGAVKREE